MSRQGQQGQTRRHHRPGRETRHRPNRQGGKALIFAGLLFLAGLFTETAASVPVLQKNGTWMVNIDSLARAEGLSTEFKPIEKHWTAKSERFTCSFVVGFPYIFANGKTIRLSAPTVFEDDAVWVPAEETMEAFASALSKSYALDSSAGVLRAESVAIQRTIADSAAVAKPKSVSPKAQPAAKKAPVQSAANAPAGSREVKNIVIDPGHGGKDPGAIGKISNEKDIVLSVGKLLEKELVRRGFRVKLTRNTDKFIPLSERPQIANRWNGDLFISLHCNSIDGARKNKVKGFRIYVLRDPESEEDRAIARRENKVASLYGEKNSKDELSPLDWLKIQARLEQYKQASYTFTEKVIRAYGEGKIPRQGSGAGGAGFMVLVGAFMPATLIELGFISNPEEERYMNSEKGQKDMAKRIADGVEEYKKAIDGYLRTLSH